jgi:cellulose synthase/poly-beta-1,6-N-acetylglucosamine synthase-like glycosyltransferase
MRLVRRWRNGIQDESLLIFFRGCFWICFAIVGYVYAGYPVLLWMGVLGRRRDDAVEASAEARFAAGGEMLPLVSVIVAAHNEEAGIAAKIRNVLASDYPRARVQILIGSDGSSDRTEEIVRKYVGDGVGLISFPQQMGKSAIQNGLVAAASGEILVFSDADCEFDFGALRMLVRHFADAEIGLVTAAPRYLNSGETEITRNESAYLGYESWIREEESRHGILAMASGSLFAMRRRLWRPLHRELGDDFELPLRVAQAGLRNLLERRAETVTRLSQVGVGAMFQLKVRIVSKDFRALRTYGALLNPFAYGATAVGLWSHKLLRWLVPYFLLGTMASSAFLSAPFYRLCFLLQVAFCAVALLGLLGRGRALGFPWSVPASFCIVHLAALLGVWKSLAGRGSGRWTPLRGQ